MIKNMSYAVPMALQSVGRGAHVTLTLRSANHE